MRCFVSINIPKKTEKEIRKIQDKLPGFFGKKTEPKNLHLTLKFLGEVSDDKVEEVKKRLSEIKIKKFETEIKNLGVFSEKFIRIIWVYLSNCGKLQKMVDIKLKELFKPEKRFMSHLTIARVKNVKDKKEFLEDLKKIKVPKIKFSIDKFYLMKSVLTKEGPKYEIMKEYDLE